MYAQENSVVSARTVLLNGMCDIRERLKRGNTDMAMTKAAAPICGNTTQTTKKNSQSIELNSKKNIRSIIKSTLEIKKVLGETVSPNTKQM